VSNDAWYDGLDFAYLNRVLGSVSYSALARDLGIKSIVFIVENLKEATYSASVVTANYLRAWMCASDATNALRRSNTFYLDDLEGLEQLEFPEIPTRVYDSQSLLEYEIFTPLVSRLSGFSSLFQSYGRYYKCNRNTYSNGTVVLCCCKDDSSYDLKSLKAVTDGPYNAPQIRLYASPYGDDLYVAEFIQRVQAAAKEINGKSEHYDGVSSCAHDSLCRAETPWEGACYSWVFGCYKKNGKWFFIDEREVKEFDTKDAFLEHVAFVITALSAKTTRTVKLCAGLEARNARAESRGPARQKMFESDVFNRA